VTEKKVTAISQLSSEELQQLRVSTITKNGNISQVEDGGLTKDRFDSDGQEQSKG
jgi:hypothetical protein